MTTRFFLYKHLVLFLLLFAAFPLKNCAQIAFGVAKDENRSVIDYKLEWGYANLFQAETAARKYLENKGYKTILFPAYDSTKIKSGYYVVVKSTYTDDKRRSHTSMGIGVSRSSYDEAEQRAVSNIVSHDWSWTKSMGYTTVEKGEFNDKAGLQCVYIIDKTKNGDCGDYASKYSYIIGTMDKRLYDNLKKGIENKCIKNNLPPSETGKFGITKRYIAILKCLQVCASDNKAYAQYKFVEVNNPDELQTIAPLSKGQLFYGSGFGYFLQQLIDLQGENSSSGIASQFISYMRSIILKTSDSMSVEEDAKQIRFGTFGSRD